MELLPDLPVEEPLDSAQRAAPLPAPPVLAAAPAAGAESKDPVQTSIQFLDPAALLLATAEVPALTPAPKADPAPAGPVSTLPSAAPKSEARPAAPAPTPELELLEDPAVVEELLTRPPPPPPAPRPLPTSPAPTLTPSAPSASTGAAPAKESAPRVEARVPIAKTASLSSAAHKLAAAGRRSEKAPPLAPAPPRPAAPAPAPAPVAKPKAAPAPAENLASWTSARAAAAPAKAKASGVVAPAPAKPAPGKTPTPAAAAPPAPTSGGAGSSAPLDRDSIARNQIVERYLSGRLPLKGATEFEQFCARHPDILDEIGLPERVNAGLRLLEAAGKPEPWQEAPRPAWQKPQVTLALAVAVGLLGMSLAVLTGTSASKSHRITELQKQVSERPLDPATSTREIRLVPSRTGASNSPAITIGGAVAGAQLADFKIDESRSPYHIYRVTIDRADQGRVAVISNLVKDSNGHLRVALNSSALGPGNYQLTIEGLNWRGDPEPDSWITIGIAARAP
ncbi:MAG TPA: hypothetical protein VH109_08480 [Steroidobacteraceae bacterium]|nr:hypothetical protein [Steroidobacteraceae bacterium]